MTRSVFVMFPARPDAEDSYIVYTYLSRGRVNPLAADICVWGANGSIKYSNIAGYKTMRHAITWTVKTPSCQMDLWIDV